LLGFGFLPLAVKLLFAAKTPVRQPRFKQSRRVVTVKIESLALAIGTELAADIRPFIPIQPEPSQVGEHLIFILAARAFKISILTAKDELPRLLTSK
jgi:hypothetical protein